MKYHTIRKKQDEQQKQVLSILMMRFGLNPYKAIPVAKRWLEKNQAKNWSDLNQMLQQGKITYKKGKLQEVRVEDLIEIVNRMKSETQGIEIKDRWYKFRLHKQTFTGSEAVEWLTKEAKMSRSEAIQFGQMLLDRGIVKQIVTGNTFEDKNLCYRFDRDETQTSSDGIEIKNTLESGFDWGDILLVS